MNRIYLDHAATTPLLPEAKQAMEAAIDEFGNPSSLHEEGRRARQLVDESREVLSRALGSQFAEVVFTGSGTEAATLAMVGVALAHRDTRNRVLISAAEHHCVLEVREVLERLGFVVELIPVDSEASIDLNALKEALNESVLLVACMHANNELGIVQPVQEVVQIAKSVGAMVFCDAVQTFLNWDWSVNEIGADLVSVSAHKVGGPKGVGALYIRPGTQVKAIMAGGGQERELRAGTENVFGMVGFAAAIQHQPKFTDHSLKFRQVLLEGGFVPSVSKANRLDHIVHGRFPGVNAESMLILLDRMGVSASSGAACSSGSIEPSHVLMACGYGENEAAEGLRFSLGKAQSEQELEDAARRIVEAAKRLLH
ncbi:MAG TPA: cysteine desulfurase family protein [Fimbriimonadaceae bacterium]|nr:cysteine desulfurase family protein [Fimbriimonadaceae bacterium]